jgi:hypothetical protein
VRAAEVILAGGTYNSPQLLQLSGKVARFVAVARYRGAPRTSAWRGIAVYARVGRPRQNIRPSTNAGAP